MAGPHIIKLLAGYNLDPRKGELKLSDNGYTEVSKNEKIEWEIQNENIPGSISVQSIVSVTVKPKKPGNYDIFQEPPKKEGGKIKGKVKDNPQVCSKICDYNITWIGSDDCEYTYDPIIAVKPVLNVNKGILFAIAVAVGAFLGIQFFRNKKKQRKPNYFSNTPES